MLVILLSGALQALAQIAMPDTVCVGATRHYFVEGMIGSTYTWKIDGVEQTSTDDNIDITWLNTGIYTLTVQEHQENCDGEVQSGQVVVIPEDTPTFDPVGPFCPGAIIPELPVTSLNGITGTWSPAIDNMETTVYTFTPATGLCAGSITLTITVEDLEPPTFTSAPFISCVDLLHTATFNPANPNPNIGVDPNLIKNPSPDYYTFRDGNTSLDISNLDDNCCDPNDMTINWRIDFVDTPDPLNPTGPMLTHASINGTGQPSALGSDMLFPGDGVYFTTVTHHITYWVEDCNGAVSDEQEQDIIINPRPKVTKIY